MKNCSWKKTMPFLIFGWYVRVLRLFLWNRRSTTETERNNLARISPGPAENGYITERWIIPHIIFPVQNMEKNCGGQNNGKVSRWQRDSSWPLIRKLLGTTIGGAVRFLFIFTRNRGHIYDGRRKTACLDFERSLENMEIWTANPFIPLSILKDLSLRSRRRRRKQGKL